MLPLLLRTRLVLIIQLTKDFIFFFSFFLSGVSFHLIAHESGLPFTGVAVVEAFTHDKFDTCVQLSGKHIYIHILEILYLWGYDGNGQYACRVIHDTTTWHRIGCVHCKAHSILIFTIHHHQIRSSSRSVAGFSTWDG